MNGAIERKRAEKQTCSTLKHPVAGTLRAKKKESPRTGGAGVHNQPARTIPDLWENKDKRTLEVLRRARALIHRDGWLQRWGDLLPQERESVRGWPLHYAITEGGVDERGIPLPESEWARQAIRRLIQDNSIPAWNDHPLRTRRQVLEVLDRAIVELGGRSARFGGPTVSHGPVGAR